VDPANWTPPSVHECFVGRPCRCWTANTLGFLAGPLKVKMTLPHMKNEIDHILEFRRGYSVVNSK
jgi:hypothetical protein